MSWLFTSTQRSPSRHASSSLAAAAPALEGRDDADHLLVGDRLHAVLPALGDVVERDRRRRATPSRGSRGSWPGRRSGSPRRTARCRPGRSPGRAGARRSAEHPAPGQPGGRRAPRATRSRAAGSAAAKSRIRSCFCEVAHDAPLVVVAVLPPSPRVDAGRLDVAVGDRADPDLLPGRRQDERLDPGERRLVGRRGCPPRRRRSKPLPRRRRVSPGPELLTRRSGARGAATRQGRARRPGGRRASAPGCQASVSRCIADSSAE